MKRLALVAIPGAFLVFLALPLLAVTGTQTAAPAAASTTCVVGTTETAPVREWDAQQTSNAATIVAVAKSLAIPPRGWLIGVATAMQESGLRNLDHGHGSSVGLFQLIAIHGTVAQRVDPVFSATWFFNGLKTIQGWQSMTLTEAAQRVQRSAFPLAYAKWEEPARALLAQVAAGVDTTACQDPVPTGPWTVPVSGYRLSAGFGQAGSRWAANHTGLDLAAPTGTPIVAASTGTVISVGPGGPYGLLTKIQHAGSQTWYAHQSATQAIPGQQVTVGQRIGSVGESGNTTGPHLHLEVRVNGIPVDPQAWLTARGAKP